MSEYQDAIFRGDVFRDGIAINAAKECKRLQHIISVKQEQLDYKDARLYEIKTDLTAALTRLEGIRNFMLPTKRRDK